MFENPRRGKQARNFTKTVPKILNLKSSSEQIFSEKWRWVPLMEYSEQPRTVTTSYKYAAPKKDETANPFWSNNFKV